MEKAYDLVHGVCNRRKLKVNASMSKEVVFERADMEVIDFVTLYRVRVPTGTGWEISLGG